MGVFSFNADCLFLSLATPLYVMSVYDRVVGAQRHRNGLFKPFWVLLYLNCRFEMFLRTKAQQSNRLYRSPVITIFLSNQALGKQVLGASPYPCWKIPVFRRSWRVSGQFETIRAFSPDISYKRMLVFAFYPAFLELFSWLRAASLASCRWCWRLIFTASRNFSYPKTRKQCCRSGGRASARSSSFIDEDMDKLSTNSGSCRPKRCGKVASTSS